MNDERNGASLQGFVGFLVGLGIVGLLIAIWW